MHEGADSMATLSVQASVTMSLFYTREITPKLKKNPEETSIIQRASQLKLNSDNKINTNVFASISFQENDKVFPKVEQTGGRLRNFEHEWQKITNDPEILTYIRDCPTDFDSEPLSYLELTNHMAFSSQECEIIACLQSRPRNREKPEVWKAFKNSTSEI